MTADRRGFFAQLIGIIITAIAVRFGQSSDGVPRRVDVRAQLDSPKVRVWLNGIEQKWAVAYDLDEQSLTRYRLDPEGRPVFALHDSFVTERGRLVVRWMEPT